MKQVTPYQDFDAFVKMIRDGAGVVGQSFTEPDEDWNTTLFFVDGDGVLNVGLVVLRDKGDKEAFAAALPGMLRARGATRAALLSSAWEVVVQADDALRDFKIEMMNIFGVRNTPGRAEVLLVEAADSGGGQGLFKAPIRRNGGGPPTLGPWETYGVNAGLGRFGGALKEGVGSKSGGRA